MAKADRIVVTHDQEGAAAYLRGKGYTWMRFTREAEKVIVEAWAVQPADEGPVPRLAELAAIARDTV